MIHEVLHGNSSMEAVRKAPSYEIHAASVAETVAKSDWYYRAFDCVIVVLSAPIVLTVLALVVLLVKLDDPRAPVFYRQTRYGKNEKPFQILKVRTMIPDADRIKVTLLEQSEDKGPGFKLEKDPRVTSPGRKLRKLYLDELPQFWNVFRGDMSLVGPRANSAHPSQLESWQRLRLSVRPGMTGTWQTMRKKPQDFNERCRIDLEYIARKSLWMDIGIMFKTVLVVLRRTGH